MLKGVKELEKESYSIDDILSEVKSRRAKENQEAKSPEISDKTNDDTIINENEDIPAEDNEDNSDMPESEKEAEQVKEEQFVINEKNAQEDEDFSISEKEADENTAAPVTEESPKKAENEAKETDMPKDAPKQEKAEYVDLLSMANDLGENATAQSEEEKEPEQKDRFFKTKKGRIIKTVLIILLIAVLVFGAAAGVYIKNALDNMTSNEPEPYDQEWRGMSQLIENYPEIVEKEASELSSLQDMIKTWYYNGAPCSSTHVTNVLLIGEDTRGSEILEEETRADSAIIVSVNIDTKQITLTSVLRDTYTYWENTPGDAATGEFGKINASMLGGIGNYINCIEKMYKIDIDNYVIVNFDSFESIIDELGGVDLELTNAEINEINNNPERYGYVSIDKTFEGSEGTLHLTGEQALAYCRIRYIDSDNARADRQKNCLFKIFEKVKDGSSVTQLKAVNALLPYVKTGFSSSEIVSIAKYALSQGWLNFDINMVNVPNARINERGAGGEYYGAWCWKSDFPQDANFVQTLLYGKSSIILAQERVDILRCNLYGFYEETLLPCYTTITNNSYGVATTYEITTEEESTTTSN